jgi:hypothetical protein
MHIPHTFPRQRLSPGFTSEGVLWHEPSQCDLLFITLNKSEALFSTSTRTRDLALGPSLFHWESGRSRRGGCRGWGWRFESQPCQSIRLGFPGF